MGASVDEAYRDRASELAELAMLAAEAKRWTEAESLARRALALDPESSEARVTLGRALESRARYSEAAAEYARATRAEPISADALENLLRVWAAPVAIFGLVGVLAHLVLRFVLNHFEQTRVVAGLLVLAVALLLTAAIAVVRRRYRFRSLTAEDRRFVQILERDRGWAAPERGPLILVGIVIAVLAAAAVTFGATTKLSTDIRPGDCFTTDERASIQKVSAIPCELPHSTEIYAQFRDPSPSGAPYPGPATLQALTFERCLARFEAFVGVKYNKQRRLQIQNYVPEQDYWDQGVRDTWCGVRRLDGGQLLGSVRQTN